MVRHNPNPRAQASCAVCLKARSCPLFGVNLPCADKAVSAKILLSMFLALYGSAGAVTACVLHMKTFPVHLRSVRLEIHSRLELSLDESCSMSIITLWHVQSGLLCSFEDKPGHFGFV